MNARTITKAQKRELRRLAALAHERDLAAAAGALEQQFNLWRQGRLDVFALNEEIHKYHNGISRELYKRYVLGEPEMALAFAVQRGLVLEKEVTPEVLDYISGWMSFFKDAGAEE